MAGHGARRRGPRPGGGRRARGRRRDRRGGQPAAHRLRPCDLLHRGACRGVGQPRPLRRASVWPAPRRRRRAGQLPGDPRARVRAGGQAPDHARDLRPVGRLLRRVLPEGAEGPDADQGRLRCALGAGLRRPCGADQPDRRLPLRRPPGRSRRDVPVGRLHAAGQHGRPARNLDPVRPVGRPAGWPPAHRAPWSEAELFGLARGYEAITADSDWRALEPTELARAADPDGPTPAERMSAMAVGGSN